MKRPIVKFFGSKWRIAKLYPAPTSVLIEPFAGGANYAMWHLQSGYTGKVILNDADPRIATLWNWLTKASRDDILDLPLLTDKPVGTDIRTLGLPDGAAELIIRWQRMGFNGCPNISAWNGKTGQYDAKIRQHIADNIHLLRNIEALNVSYQDIPIIDGATYFIDPPYQFNTVRYFDHDPLNYQDLASWCKSLPGQVIVCEQPPANWLPFKTLGEFAGKMQKVKHTELIWTNDDSKGIPTPEVNDDTA